MLERMRWAAAAAMLATAPGLGAVGGSIGDGAVSLAYPATHWNGSAAAHLTGTRLAPAEDVVYASGWWYRLNNVDSREHPLPTPASESYGAGRADFSYPNVDGKEFDVVEYLPRGAQGLQDLVVQPREAERKLGRLETNFSPDLR